MSTNASDATSNLVVLEGLITRLRHDWRILFDKGWDYSQGLDALAVNECVSRFGNGQVFEQHTDDERTRITIRHADPQKPPILWTVSTRGWAHFDDTTHDRSAAANNRAKFTDTIEYLRSWLELAERRRVPEEPPSEHNPRPAPSAVDAAASGLSPDPLLAVRTELKLREAKTLAQESQRTRRSQLEELFIQRFNCLITFAGGLLAPEQRPRRETFFRDLAQSLLAFSATVREYDREFPRLQILERLRRASRSGVPALDTAASLLLLAPDVDFESLVGDLERIQGSRPHDVWLMWLTYILDQLVNSHRPPLEKNNVPPDTTREEWRKAELAFGCVLFPDESFRVMQEAVERGASQVEDALACGGYPALSRPPCRVRDLIACFDPRALHWYSSESLPHPGLLQPPPSIEAITEPPDLRRVLDEVWTAANVLRIVLDNWAAWFVTLQQTGDAEPGVALHYHEGARRAVSVLLTYRPQVAPFDQADETAVLTMLPPLPAWWVPGADVSLGPGRELIEAVRPRWQEDREFLDRYYAAPERRIQRAAELRGATAQVIDLLKSYPAAALAANRTQPATKGSVVSIAKMEFRPTIGIITALPHETAAVRAVLGEPARLDVSGAGAGRAYWTAEVPSLRGGIHRVVLAQADMGNNLAAVRASLLLSHFPKVDVIMCGIAGGIPHPTKAAEHVRLGDIVVSNLKGVVQYDFVKRTMKRKRTYVPDEVRASPHRPSAVLLEMVNILQTETHLGKQPWETLIREGSERLGWTRPDDSADVLAASGDPLQFRAHPVDQDRRASQPRVFLGPIASANTLLKDPAKRDALRDSYGAKAVEMEGSGIQDATWTHGVGYLVVRGICDYCDANKNDLWQRYAAVAAAGYVRSLLEAMPGSHD